MLLSIWYTEYCIVTWQWQQSIIFYFFIAHYVCAVCYPLDPWSRPVPLSAFAPFLPQQLILKQKKITMISSSSICIISWIILIITIVVFWCILIYITKRFHLSYVNFPGVTVENQDYLQSNNRENVLFHSLFKILPIIKEETVKRFHTPRCSLHVACLNNHNSGLLVTCCCVTPLRSTLKSIMIGSTVPSRFLPRPSPVLQPIFLMRSSPTPPDTGAALRNWS